MASEKHSFLYRLRFPLLIVLTIWIVHIFQLVTYTSLSYLGIYPRNVIGLKGILFAPMIHGDFNHLISNTFPLLILTAIISVFYRRVLLKGFFTIYLLTGLAVWLFAREVYHIGASGIVYGLLCFVFWTGIFRRNVKSIVLALIVTILYAGFVWGVLPIKAGVSFESHLFGALSGILAAFLFRYDLEQDEEDTSQDEPDEDDRTYFLERDVFEQTKLEKLTKKARSYPDWYSSDPF